MVRKTFITFIFLLFLFPQYMSANEDAWSYLDDLTDQAILLTKQEKYEEAKKMLEHFSVQFVKRQPDKDNLTMNDLRVISISTDEAIKALTAVTLEHSERIRKVTQLRLAVDALHTEHQPLWRAMEDSVLNSFKKLKDAALSNNKEEFKLQFNIFSTKLDTIYPSLVIDLDPEYISRLDSHLRFLEAYDHVSEKNKKEHLKVMEKDILKLFGKTTDDEADPSLIWVIVTTGGIIFTALLYVGWRKYKGEKITIIKYRGRP